MAARKELSARTGYSGNDLDRQSDKRDDPAYVEAQRRDPEARTFVLAGDNVVLERDSDGYRSLFTFAEAAARGAARETAFLGHDGVGGVFATLLEDAPQDLGPTTEQLQRIYRNEAPAAGKSAEVRTDLRSMLMQGMVSEKIAGRLAQAKSLMYWHSRHRFCSNCGTPTDVGAAGWKRTCPHCKAEHFPRTDPVVIMLAVSGEKCLLGRQPRFPKGMYSALAGFVEGGETLEDAVRREIKEESGVPCGRVSYLASQPWPFPCSLMIGALAEAEDEKITIDRTELDDARWFSREEALKLVDGKLEGFFCPPKLAIAHHLIAAWARGEVS
ncbi:MAG: NAD(+) diphosphatase [Hyphomicrobiales bacterium]|nr:NAD(+) diphosphatase [Hyphomicrobiales bacterium]